MSVDDWRSRFQGSAFMVWRLWCLVQDLAFGTPWRPGGIMSITYGRDTISSVILSVEARGFGDASGDTAVRMLTKPHLPVSCQSATPARMERWDAHCFRKQLSLGREAGKCRARVASLVLCVHGYLAHKAPSLALCLGPYSGPREGELFLMSEAPLQGCFKRGFTFSSGRTCS